MCNNSVWGTADIHYSYWLNGISICFNLRNYLYCIHKQFDVVVVGFTYSQSIQKTAYSDKRKTIHCNVQGSVSITPYKH